MSNAGMQILREMSKKGLRGYFFDSAQYHELKKIDDIDDAKTKIYDYGYETVMEAENPYEVVKLLKDGEYKRDRNGGLIYAVCEMIFWFVISLVTCSA